MLEFFTVVNGEAQISPEVRNIPLIRQLIRRDKGSEGDHEGRFKLMAMKELSYIVHMNRPFGPYSDEYPLTKRATLIKKHYRFPEEWEPDGLIESVTELYKESFTSLTTELLESAIKAAYKIKHHFDNIDLNERDDKKKPIWDSTKLLNDVSKAGSVLKGLEDLRVQMMKELSAAPVIKGGGTKGMDEDPE